MRRPSPAEECFAAYLSPIAGSVSSSLISPADFAAMTTVSGPIPGTVGHNTFGFECRLGDDEPRADLLVQATAAHGLTDLGRHRVDDYGNAFAPVHRFASAWNDGSALLRDTVDNVWLEFDIGGENPTIPSVFFGFRATTATKNIGYAANIDRYVAATRAAGALLRAGDRGDESVDLPDAVGQCFAALPETAQVFQVGFMLSRATQAVRLCLRLKELEDAFRYLASVGWCGDLCALRRSLEPLANLADRVCLDIDVDETVHPKVGLECYVEADQRWAPLLDCLRDIGLCTASRRDAVLAYPGHVTQDSTPTWPLTLARTAAFARQQALSIAVKSLHHVKVGCRPDGPPEAKAYLAATYGWYPLRGTAKDAR